MVSGNFGFSEIHISGLDGNVKGVSSVDRIHKCVRN